MERPYHGAKGTKKQVTYPGNYSPKTVAEQISIMKSFFMIEDVSNSIVPKHTRTAEGVFIFLDYTFIDAEYQKACGVLLEHVATVVDVDIGTSKNVIDTIEKIENKHFEAFRQGKQLFALPAQVGLKYQHESPTRAKRRFSKNEIGLGVFESLCIVLTHPERFSSFYDLGMDCVGDTCSKIEIPTIEFIDKLTVSTGSKIYGNEFYGTASAFLPTK